LSEANHSGGAHIYPGKIIPKEKFKLEKSAIFSYILFFNTRI